MLTITIPKNELWDGARQEFIEIKKDTTLRLEHSLVSLSKWESKYCRPFLSEKPKTKEETIDYIIFMTITQNIDPIIYRGLTNKNMTDINEYLIAPMTATTFSSMNPRRSSEFITSELIYYWMISLGIPFECEKWHLNRLFTLIRVCSEKNKPQEKRSQSDILKEYDRINKMNRARFNTKG